MPKSPAATLTWSPERNAYTLHTSNQQPMWIESGAEGAWFVWLATHTSFAFQGQHGHLNVFKETRVRGAGYWYAYHTQSGQTLKRYLGRSATVTLACLEEAAHSLDRQAIPDASSSPAPSTSDRPPTSSHYLEQGQQPSLLLPKFRPPRLLSLSVWRQRLLVRMEEGRQGKLTLVIAPAGSGKTTLVRQWMETQDPDMQAAWLSLDPEDDDPIRFWHYVLTACARCEGQPGHAALKLLSTNQSFFTLLFLKQILTSFLNDAAGLASRLLLILDD